MRVALALALVLLARTANAQGLVVAVFDIEGPTLRLKPAAIDGLSEYLATQLAAAGTLRVVPRADLHERLKSQKAASFKTCYQESCQIEIGKELAAQAVVSTKLIRIDKRCVAAMKLYDLRSATAIAAATREGACNESALLQLLNESIAVLVENAKTWQLRAAWQALESELPALDAAERVRRLSALLERYPGHKPAIDARALAERELQAAARAEADKNKALGKVLLAGGHWCFPGQAFGNGRCVGVPTSCPRDFAIDAPRETCAPPPCTAGRERTADGVHCCWKNQIWSPERRVCVGNPTCPPGQVAHRERCGEPVAPLLANLRRLLDGYEYRVHSDRDACSPIVYRYKLESVQPCSIVAVFTFVNEASESAVNCQDYAADAGDRYALNFGTISTIHMWDQRGQGRRSEEAFMRAEGNGGLTYVARHRDVVMLTQTLKRLAFVCGAEDVEVHQYTE